MTIDGKPTQTSATGTLDNLINLVPVPVTLCTPSGGLQLSAGTHMFEAVDPYGPFEVGSLTLQPTSKAHAAGMKTRTASVQRWGAETRTIRVGAGPATYLVVSQNYNSSWHATMDNQPLKSIRVRRVEQGYLVPAGKAGTVTLSVPANSLYQGLLVLGAALLVGLLLLALVPSNSESTAALKPRTSPNFWLILGVSTAVLVVIAGSLALLLIPLLIVARRWGLTPVIVIALVAFIAAGVVVARHPAPTSLLHPDLRRVWASAQIGSVVAFAAVISLFVTDSWTTDSPTVAASETDTVRASDADVSN